ncbi:MAG: squalene/phytoene synthase family protein [Pseudomonadota bacterium]|nr:squalene/phytoene synthase family protein [Pseudomonadota bacterium]
MPQSPIDLAIALAPPTARAALTALFALDARLAEVASSTREPTLGQLRLAWWRDALDRLDRAPTPAEPTLRALENLVLLHGVTGADLSGMAAGWEAIVAGPTPDLAALVEYGTARGSALFGAAARVLGTHINARIDAAGRGWAVAEIMRRWSDPTLIALARGQASSSFDEAFATAWPSAERTLGILALLAMHDIAEGDAVPGRLRSATMFIKFRVTGKR